MSELLKVEGLSVTFGGLKALNDVYIELNKSEVLGLIGPNGAGKTTLFNAISGLVPPSSGKISFDGKNSAWPKTHQLAKLGIARTLQGVGLFSGLTALENVMVGAEAHASNGFFADLFGASGKSEAKLKAKAHKALAWAGATQLAERYPSQLTYPDSKRVALARALVLEPKILLLDEPAAGLGHDEIEKLANLVLQLKEFYSIIVVEHNVEFVNRISDRVYVLNFGEVIASGPFERVRQDPAVVAAYLGTSTPADIKLGSGN
jgi:branched-chain amino acid transport system ATP-binding protein